MLKKIHIYLLLSHTHLASAMPRYDRLFRAVVFLQGGVPWARSAWPQRCKPNSASSSRSLNFCAPFWQGPATDRRDVNLPDASQLDGCSFRITDWVGSTSRLSAAAAGLRTTARSVELSSKPVQHFHPNDSPVTGLLAEPHCTAAWLDPTLT